MLKFKIQHFIRLCELLAQIRGLGIKDEKDTSLHLSLFGASSIMQNDQKTQQAKHEVELVILSLEGLEKQCESLRLKICLKKIKDTLASLRRDTCENYKYDIEQISKLIKYELEEIFFFSLPPDKGEYYDLPINKWKKVIDKHPELMTDIDEAGKCLALGRYTASVFHLMRVMETGVQLLGKKVGIKGYKEMSWHNIIEDIKDRIEKKWPSSHKKLTSAQKEKRKNFNEILTYLMSVKHAWRNEVMHPKDTYTDEEAVAVYLSVANFMNRLVYLT